MLTTIPSSFSWQDAQSILEEAYEKCIFVRPIFVEIMGSLQAGAYLSCAHFWSGKGRNPEWTYKTCEEFKGEIFLSRSQQDKVRAELKKKDWWEEKTMKVGHTPKFHFKIDKKKLDEEVILHILNKTKDHTPSDLSESRKSDLLTVDKSRTEISTQSISITKSKSLTEQPEKSADAESLISFQETRSALNPLKTHSNPLNEEIYQPTREDTKQSILEGNQPIEQPLPVSNLTLSQEKDFAALRTTKPDKTKTIFNKPTSKTIQQDRAKTSSHIDRGIQNKRWKDLEDFKRFRDYAIEWARQRRERITPSSDGMVYDDRWVETVISRTATCAIEDSPILTCWKAWTMERPAPPLFVTPQPQVDEPLPQETLDMVAAYLAKNRIEREAREAQRRRYQC